MQHRDSARKSGWLRRLAVVGAAVLLLALFVLAARFLPGGKQPAGAAALALPDGERPRYRIHIKAPETAGVLAVTEEIEWRNPGGEPLDRLCLRVNANAYTLQSASPAAADDLLEAAYPNGFDAASVTLEGCWVNGELTETRFDSERLNLLWADGQVPPGETVRLRLHMQVRVPECASIFGQSGGITRLMQALPTVAVRYADSWDTRAACAYGAPQDIALSDVSVTADLPAGMKLLTGAETGTNQVSALIVPDTLASAAVQTEGLEVSVLAETRERAEAIAAAVRAVWPVYTRRYGRLPLERLTVVSLPLADSGFSVPGLVLLNSALTENALRQQAAYWLAGQWFGWAVSMDNAAEAWFCCAARQWAALRYIREADGADAEAAARALQVDMPMRENLHAAVTAGTPADGFPDLATFRTVMDGRATALFYALDEWTSGGFDALLSRLLQEHAFERISRETFAETVRAAAGLDIAPLLTDWLDTYIQETP